MRILSLSSVYPSAGNPGSGLFVRARLQRVAAEADVKVVAPVFALDAMRARGGKVPARRTDGRVEVLHPWWFYVPGTGAPTALLLFAGMLWPVFRIRREFPFDLIDAHFGYPEGIAAALLAWATGTPFTVTMRGSECEHSAHWLRRRLMRWACRRARRVISVSDELRRLAIGLGVDPARTRTIPNGVDAEVFHPRDREQARARFGFPANRKVILTAGYLIERKGHDRIVAALARLRDRGRDVELAIAGGRPARGVDNSEPKIRRLVEELGLAGRVRFLGPLPPAALAEAMSAADIFCLGSSREGWPNVVHEALACGTPVVAAKVGAVPELLPAERYGFIVPPCDVAALADALDRALDAPWDREAIVAWAHARSWERVAGEVLDEMRQALSEGGRVSHG